MRLLSACFCAMLLSGKTASAGAWLPPETHGKIIVNRIVQEQRKDSISEDEGFRHRETYHSVLLEYGWRKDIAIAAKGGRQERHEPGEAKRFDEARLGLIFDTPKLATGLLPPYVFRMIKAAFPSKKFTREKRASLTLGLHNKPDEYWSALAQADRISIGRLRVSQEVELDRIKGDGRDWRNWLYRFSLGHGAVDVGTEAHHFIDYSGTYQALAHTTYVQWKPRQSAWQMRVKYGNRRAPMGQFAIMKNDYLALEIEWAF